MKKNTAFTLIELLIVVAIIAILAAIAVPNFLEAQVRSKVSATKASMRSIATALETYRLDYDSYPHYPSEYAPHKATGFMNSNNQATVDLWKGYTPFSLTTPVAYMSSIPHEVFVNSKGYYKGIPEWEPCMENKLLLYHYEHDKSKGAPLRDIGSRWTMDAYFEAIAPEAVKYLLLGAGPDLQPTISTQRFHNNVVDFLEDRSAAVGWSGWYDPSNGTVSGGDIIYHGPGVGFDRSILRKVR